MNRHIIEGLMTGSSNKLLKDTWIYQFCVLTDKEIGPYIEDLRNPQSIYISLCTQWRSRIDGVETLSMQDLPILWRDFQQGKKVDLDIVRLVEQQSNALDPPERVISNILANSLYVNGLCTSWDMHPAIIGANLCCTSDRLMEIGDACLKNETAEQ